MKLSTTPYLGSAPNATYFGAKFGQQQGLWLTDPWGKQLDKAPIPAKAREELAKFQSSSDSDVHAPEYSGDAISRRLDTITLEDHMMARGGISRETIREFLSPGDGAGYGLGPDALSGFTAYAADMLHPLDISDETGQQMFPDGNSGIARLIVKTLIPESIAGDHSLEDVCRNAVNFAALDHAGATARIRLDSTAVWVKHDGEPAKVRIRHDRLHARREDVSRESTLGGDGRRKLDHASHRARSLRRIAQKPTASSIARPA